MREITKYTVTLSDGSYAIYTMNKPNNSFVSMYDKQGKFIKSVTIKEEDYLSVLQLLEKAVIK